jgi:hypothetical protein
LPTTRIALEPTENVIALVTPVRENVLFDKIHVWDALANVIPAPTECNADAVYWNADTPMAWVLAELARRMMSGWAVADADVDATPDVLILESAPEPYISKQEPSVRTVS